MKAFREAIQACRDEITHLGYAAPRLDKSEGRVIRLGGRIWQVEDIGPNEEFMIMREMIQAAELLEARALALYGMRNDARKLDQLYARIRFLEIVRVCFRAGLLPIDPERLDDEH